MKYVFIIGFWLCSFTTLLAQSQWFVGSNIALGSQKNAAAIWAKQEWGFGKQHQFKIGYGLRITMFNAYQSTHVTAPWRLTQGPANSVGNPNIDTLFIAEQHSQMANLFISLGYTLKEKIEFKFTIDALGVSTGKSVEAEHITNTQAPANSPRTQTLKAKPHTLNALLVSDNDIGSLNSDFTVGYWVTPKWNLFAGYTFLFSEYQTEKIIRNENDRFRFKASLGTLGIVYKIK